MRRRNIVIALLTTIPICLIIGAVVFLRSAYLLEKIRATLETRLGQQLEQPLLFSIAYADSHAVTLDNGRLPGALRSAFADYGIEFSHAVSVLSDDKPGEWVVSDKNHKWRYAIRRDGNETGNWRFGDRRFFNVFKYIVSIGDLSGDIFTGLSLKQFEISDRKLRHHPLISAEEIVLKYDLLRLIGGKFHITKLRFMRPELNLRMREDGRLNLTSIAPQTDSTSDSSLPFQFGISNIEFVDGHVNYEDGERNLKIAVSGIQSRVEGPLDRWEHSGHLAIQDGSFELNDVETKIHEFKTRFKLLAGEGELKEMQLAMGKSRVAIAGKVRDFTEASRYLETRIDLDIDLRDLQNLLPDRFEVAGNARINLEAKGTSSDISGNLHLELRAAAFNNFQLEELNVNAEFNRNALKLTDVNGTLASGKLTAGLQARFGSLGRRLFSLMSISEQSPRDTTAQTPSSEENAESPIAYDGWVKLEDANVEEILPVFIDLPEDFLTMTGILDSHLHISGSLPITPEVSPQSEENPKSAIADSLTLTGGLKIDQAAMNDVPIRVSEASFQIAENQLHVAANLDDANIRVNGAAGLEGALDLDLEIRRIDTGKLMKIIRAPNLGGDATLRGKITSEVPLTGFLEIPEASLFDVPIGVLTANFHYQNGSVTLQPVRLSKGESLLTLTGVAQVEGDIPVEFRVRAHPLQISDYVRLLAGAEYPVEGIVTGNLALDGTLNGLDGRGRLNVASAKAWDLELDPLILPLVIEDYTLHVSDFEVFAREQRGVVNFQITPELDYQLQFQSDPMRLKELAIARAIPEPDFLLDADLLVHATGEGNAANPRVDVNFDFSDIIYDNHTIIPEGDGNRNSSEIRISGVFTENALRFEGTGFDGSSQIRGIIESTLGNPYQLFMRSNGINISPILGIFHKSFKEIPGTANGTFQLSGTLLDLTQFTLDTSISSLALEVNGRRLTNAAPIRFGFIDNIWKVDSFSLANLEGKTIDTPFVTCRLTLDDQSIDFVAESRDFRLEPLCGVLALPATLTGRANYKLIGTGTLANPELTLEWAIPELRVENAPVPIVVSEASGKVAYTDHTLTVEPFNFLLTGVPVEAEATAAVNLNSLQSSTVDLRTYIVDFDLGSMNLELLFEATHDWQPTIKLSTEGQLNLDAHLTGTFSDPRVDASIGVTDAKVHVLDYPQPLENINLDLRVVGGDGTSDKLLTVTANTAAWQIGEGRYQAKANWQLPRTKTQTTLVDRFPSLSELDPSFQLQLDGKGINLTDFARHFVNKIGSHEISEYLFSDKITRAIVDSRLELDGGGYSLDRISAQLTLDNLHVDFINRDMLTVEPIRAELADGTFRINSFQIGSPSSMESNEGEENGDSVVANQSDNRQSPNIAKWADTRGWINLDGDLEFDFELMGFPFGALLPGMTVPLFNSTVGVEASLTGVAHVGGNIADPVIDAEWEAHGSIGDRLTSHFLEFADTGRVEYRDRVFEIKQTELSGYGNHLTIQGSIPIDLRLQPHDLNDRFLDQPVHLTIRSQEADLSFLSRFQPQLETVEGIADVNFTIRGTTAAPILYGTASLHDGMVKFTNFDTPISNTRISLRADGEELRVPEFRFEIGEGKYALNVYCDMNGLLPRTVEVRSFHAQQAQLSDFARNVLPAKMAANLTGHVTAQGHLSLPIERFVTAGDAPWLPKIILPLTPHNLASHAAGGLKVEELFINALDYEVRNLNPLECHLAAGQLNLADGFILQDQRVGIGEKERFTLVVENGQWSVSGKEAVIADDEAPYTGHYVLDMRTSNLNLGFISDFLPKGYVVDGLLNSELSVRGTGENPELTCRWDTSDLSINSARVDECVGRIAYRNGKLHTEEPARFVIGSNRADFSGSIPFDLSLDRLHANLPSPNLPDQANTIEGRLDVFIEDLEFLPLIQRQIGFAEGSGSVNVTIGGQIDALQLKGVANFPDLAFNLPDANINVKKTDITVDFTNEGFQIRGWEGILNGGAYTAEGSGSSHWHRIGYVDLTATLEGGSTFEDYGLYRITCGEVNLFMKGAVGGDESRNLMIGNSSGSVENLPPIQGTVRIVEGTYERHWQDLVNEWFDQAAELHLEVWSDYPIMRDLRFDLDVVAANDFRVVSNVGKLDIEVSIDGKLSGRIQKPSFIGRVNLLPRSEFTLESIIYPFTIEEGSYVENKHPFEFNPRYKIFAKTLDPIERVQVISTDGAHRTRDVEISVRLSGYLREDEQRHRSQFYADVLRRGAGEEYDLSQAQIISILATGDVAALERSPLGASLPFVFRPSYRYFGNRLGRLIGMREPVVDINPTGDGQPRWLLSREIFERLLVTVNSTFQIHAEPRIEVEYRIKRGLSVTGERSEQGKYGVDLKLEQRF